MLSDFSLVASSKKVQKTYSHMQHHLYGDLAAYL